MTEPTDAEILEVIREAARGGAIRRAGSTSLRIARAVLARWGQPSGAGEPVAYLHKHKHSGMVELSLRRMTDNDFNRARWECIPLYTAPQPTQAVPPAGREPLTPEQITAAAKKLAECMEYPWEFMPEPGRANMRKHAQAVIEAAQGIKGKEAGNADT